MAVMVVSVRPVTMGVFEHFVDMLVTVRFLNAHFVAMDMMTIAVDMRVVMNHAFMPMGMAVAFAEH